MTTKQFDQSPERLQVECLLLSMKIHHQAKLARNYKILPFKFSKIVKDMKRKIDKVYCKC